MGVITNITVDLASPNISAVVYAKQLDKQSRTVVMTMYENGSPWTPPSGSSYMIQARKPDGTILRYNKDESNSNAINVSGNTATIKLVQQALTEPGKVKMELVITSSGSTLTTFSWILEVERSAISGDASTNYLNPDISSVASVDINSDRHLIVQTTSGKTHDAGLLSEIKTAYINDAGHLIITTTTNSTIDAGRISGVTISGSSSWADLTDKPFTTLGTSMTVVNGTLNAKSETWTSLSGKPFSSIGTGFLIQNGVLNLKAINWTELTDRPFSSVGDTLQIEEGVLNVKDIGTSSWTELSDKPFDTIGPTLHVENGVLNALTSGEAPQLPSWIGETKPTYTAEEISYGTESNVADTIFDLEEQRAMDVQSLDTRISSQNADIEFLATKFKQLELDIPVLPDWVGDTKPEYNTYDIIDTDTSFMLGYALSQMRDDIQDLKDKPSGADLPSWIGDTKPTYTADEISYNDTTVKAAITELYGLISDLQTDIDEATTLSESIQEVIG